MSRKSNDHLIGGVVWDGYDYNLQVWVKGVVVQPCYHPEPMRSAPVACCNAKLYGGQPIKSIKGHEIRLFDDDV